MPRKLTRSSSPTSPGKKAAGTPIEYRDVEHAAHFKCADCGSRIAFALVSTTFDGKMRFAAECNCSCSPRIAVLRPLDRSGGITTAAPAQSTNTPVVFGRGTARKKKGE